MAEYIKREDALKEVDRSLSLNEAYSRIASRIIAADVVEASTLKEFAEDVAYQFGYAINCNGRIHWSSGGLSTLEWAFDILGWDDPKPYPEGECEWDGCHAYATCGTPTPDGYKRVCGKHFAIIRTRKEAEKDGE